MGFSGMNKEQKANDAQIKAITGKIGEAADTAGARGEKGFKWFKQSTKPVMDFWKTILSGDRTAISKLLTPELSTISNTYSNAKNNLWMSPRGGGKVSAVNELEAAQARDTNNLFAAARPQAAGQLASLGNMFGNFSLGETGQQFGGYGGQSENLFGLNKEQEEMRKRQAAAWGALGQGIGSIAGGAISGGLFSGV